MKEDREMLMPGRKREGSTPRLSEMTTGTYINMRAIKGVKTLVAKCFGIPKNVLMVVCLVAPQVRAM